MNDSISGSIHRKMPSKWRIIVTGAAGFVGSHLCERFIADGHEVIGIDNFLTGRMSNLKSLTTSSRFDFVEYNIVDPLPLDCDADWVMHFASPASPPKYRRHPIQCMRVNAEGTRHLLEFARQCGASFFMASTSEVYGDPLIHPQPEGYRGHVNTVGPRSMYDEAKRYAETMTRQYAEHHDVPVRIIRIFNTYGPRMAPDDGRVVSNFICQAISGEPLTVYGDGSQTRSFQYISDLVEGITRLMNVDYQMPVNVGNPDEYTVLELAEHISDLLDVGTDLDFFPLPGDDPKQRRPNIDLARRILDWSPQVGLTEGLRSCIAHFREELTVGRDDSSEPKRLGM